VGFSGGGGAARPRDSVGGRAEARRTLRRKPAGEGPEEGPEEGPATPGGVPGRLRNTVAASETLAQGPGYFAKSCPMMCYLVKQTFRPRQGGVTPHSVAGGGRQGSSSARQMCSHS